MKKKVITCIVLGIFVITLSYLIFKTNILEPKLNELTTSYISFNTENNSDILDDFVVPSIEFTPTQKFTDNGVDKYFSIKNTYFCSKNYK